MNLKPAKVGAEPKKMAVLGILALIVGYLIWSNFISGGSSPSTPAAPRRPAASSAGALPVVSGRMTPRRSASGRDSLAEFRPSLKRKKDDFIDPSRIDPTLKLALLARLQEVPPGGGNRSLFDFATAPVANEPALVNTHGNQPKPMPPPVAANADPPAPPPPPPIPLKFYGFVSATSNRRAFFLDGEDIVVAEVGDLIKKRYKVVRIGLTSAVVEDEELHNQQTLPLPTDQQPG